MEDPMTPQHEVIATCPVCAGDLAVTRLHCSSCGTALEGRFTVGRFSRLDAEQLAVLESFLRSRGNLREMERDLGISYPTVRNRIDVLLRALGLDTGPATPESDEEGPGRGDPAGIVETRQTILERLARGEIDAEDAAAAIRAAGRTV
jgi:hypothetical protein